MIEQHGVKFTNDFDQLNRSLGECGIVYLHAPLFAKAMKCVAPIRKALQFPTLFNLLGPLDELRRRLEGRATDAPEVIEARLARAEFELSQAPKFDHVVVNDNLDCAVAQTYGIVKQFIGE